jgi:hypothetical protein
VYLLTAFKAGEMASWAMALAFISSREYSGRFKTSS